MSKILKPSLVGLIYCLFSLFMMSVVGENNGHINIEDPMASISFADDILLQRTANQTLTFSPGTRLEFDELNTLRDLYNGLQTEYENLLAEVVLLRSTVFYIPACIYAPCNQTNTFECRDFQDPITNVSVADCICKAGYSGSACELDAQECASSPCINGGSCSEPDIGEFHCECPPLFFGETCEKDGYSPLGNRYPNGAVPVFDATVAVGGSGIGGLVVTPQDYGYEMTKTTTDHVLMVSNLSYPLSTGTMYVEFECSKSNGYCLNGVSQVNFLPGLPSCSTCFPGNTDETWGMNSAAGALNWPSFTLNYDGMASIAANLRYGLAVNFDTGYGFVHHEGVWQTDAGTGPEAVIVTPSTQTTFTFTPNTPMVIAMDAYDPDTSNKIYMNEGFFQYA